MNTKICSNCNETNLDTSNYCKNCGTQLKTEIENPVVENKKDKGNFYAILSSILFFGGFMVSYLIPLMTSYNYNAGNAGSMQTIMGTIGPVITLSGIILMIVGRVLCPKNKPLKVIMWVMIGLIILSILYTVLSFVLMFMFCTACLNSGIE